MLKEIMLMSSFFKILKSIHNFIALLIGNIVLIIGLCGVSLVSYVLVGDLLHNKEESRREKML